MDHFIVYRQNNRSFTTFIVYGQHFCVINIDIVDSIKADSDDEVQ